MSTGEGSPRPHRPTSPTASCCRGHRRTRVLADPSPQPSARGIRGDLNADGLVRPQVSGSGEARVYVTHFRGSLRGPSMWASPRASVWNTRPLCLGPRGPLSARPGLTRSCPAGQVPQPRPRPWPWLTPGRQRRERAGPSLSSPSHCAVTGKLGMRVAGASPASLSWCRASSPPPRRPSR